ncbi:MAG: hypothetical protein FWC41_01900 [Firmicutes bacterium]|nr:hypothetical protein [Bacillota bacterium]
MHNIVKKPFGVDFIQNDLKFVFHGNNVRVAGSKSYHTIQFLSQPAVGDKFILKVNEKEFTYTIISTTQSDDSIYKIISNNGSIFDDFIKKLNLNFYLSNIFNFSLAPQPTGIILVRFNAKEVGVNRISIQRIIGTFGAAIGNSLGRERVYFKDYKFLVYFDVEYAQDGNIIKETLPAMLLDADINGYATLPCDILAKLSKSIDIPLSANQAYRAYILNHLLIRYSLLCYEMYEGEVQNVKESGLFYGINGRVSTSGANINRPDWNDIFSSTLEKCEWIRLFGCDNNKTFQSHYNGRDCLYLSLFDTSKPSTHSKILSGTLEALYADGTKNTITLMDLTIANYSVARVPTSLRAFSILNRANIIQYTITLWNSDRPTQRMKRTYNVNATPYHIHEFFLQNKYGVIEYFFAETRKIETQTKADIINVDNINDIQFLEKNKIYTVNTGIKDKNQLKLLSQAVHSQHNFIITKNRLIPIFIVPESIKIIDESKDLQETSFKYQYKDENTDEFILLNAIEGSQEPYNPFGNRWQDTKAPSEPNYWDDRDVYNETNTPNIWQR